MSLVDRFDHLVATRRRPVPAAVAGIVVVCCIGLVSSRFHGSVGTAPKALALMLPVLVTAAVGGGLAAYVVAVAAAGAFGFVVPPYGSVRVALAQDLWALAAFLVVAVVVSTVVARRIHVLAALEEQHALLLRSVSHDFRTPLALIRAASTDMLDADLHSTASRARLVALIDDEADRLDRLVANLLDLSRIEAGTLEPRLQRTDLSLLVDRCAVRLHRLFDTVALDVDIAPEADAIDVDPTLVDQLVTNLLENAARHAASDGRVAVHASRDGRLLVIEVDDDGPGIAPERRSAVFDMFQASGATAGSGIGLAICKAIAEAHGGTIAVGESAGGGARFTVRMPA